MKKPKDTPFLLWRQKHGLTQDQLAAISGRRRRTIVNWDRGMIPHKSNQDELVRNLKDNPLGIHVEATAAEIFGL